MGAAGKNAALRGAGWAALVGGGWWNNADLCICRYLCSFRKHRGVRSSQPCPGETSPRIFLDHLTRLCRYWLFIHPRQMPVAPVWRWAEYQESWFIDLKKTKQSLHWTNARKYVLVKRWTEWWTYFLSLISLTHGPNLAQILSYQRINYPHPLISYIYSLRLLFLSSNASYPLPSRLLLLNRWDYFLGGHARFIYTAKSAWGVGVKTTIRLSNLALPPWI